MSEGVSVDVKLPPKLIPLFAIPFGQVRYRCAYGGRGSGKSTNFALMAAVLGAVSKKRILCVREYHKSIKESFHAELRGAIEREPWLAAQYDVGVDYLRHKQNGTEFLFVGMQNSIKSLSRTDLSIIEEAEDLSEEHWRELRPTVRNEDSEIWAIWNPKTEGSAVDQLFIKNVNPEAVVVEMNYNDNPWFPNVLEAERLYDLSVMSPEVYNHVWEGKYLKETDALILKSKVKTREFEADPNWDGAYYGLDWGFAQDPTAAVRCWVNDNTLYVDYEAGQVGLGLDATAAFLIERIPNIAEHTMRADSARPESIDMVRRTGLPKCVKVKKTTIEDGIDHLRSFKEIVIHPRCKELRKECSLYSYKVNKGGDILRDVVDANNHYLDALRYAIRPLMKAKLSSGAINYNLMAANNSWKN